MTGTSNLLPTQYQQFIHLSRYSRWLPEKKRRETWTETVARYFDFFEKHLHENCQFVLKKDLRDELERAVLELRVMPSMRCLMTAGEALARDNVAGYNCSYAAIDRPHVFDEIMNILMNGVGVGFSVEHKHVTKLPVVSEDFSDTSTTIVVADSRTGWARAFRELLALLYQGQVPKWDMSRLRPAGAPLKIFGGRASGPAPLNDLFEFAVRLFRGATGRRLTTLECHDLVCKIADIVVVGGVRRSATISLSDLGDAKMRAAKSGRWWEDAPHRALANNSTAYDEKPSVSEFMDEWKSLYDSKSGERGIFNRVGIVSKLTTIGRRDVNHDFGINPCGEIVLRDREFCNLTETIIRSGDKIEDIKDKVRLAAILGTFQATLTNFKYLSKKWRENCEEERLLGVSLTGIMDNELMNGKKSGLDTRLQEVRNVAIDTNVEWAKNLKINKATAVTCGKPSGTVSQLVDSASGIHARHSRFYVRTVRADKKDPLAKMMRANGFPVEDDVTKPEHMDVFSFPIKAPAHAVTRNDMSAIEQLEIWMTYQDHWCEHNPSVTISVREHEWLEVGAWVYRHFDKMNGVSFLPHTDHVYRQSPYQECDEYTYKKALAAMPRDVDWSKLAEFEDTDLTWGAQELACSGGVCDI